MNTPILNLRHLRAFREVARRNNVSEASGYVHLSQPAITQAIAKLEDLLDIRLFDRRTDGMFVTDIGERFLARVDRALTFLARGASAALQTAPRSRNRGFNNFDQLLTATQLRALVAVSRAKNFSLAAKQAGVSQPSLHRAARDMERLSGVPLFQKVSHGIQLTRSGEVLTKFVKLAQAELDQSFIEISELKGFDAGVIVIGSLPLARAFVLPRAINQLAERFPDVQVNVVDGPYDDLLHGLRHGEIDMLIGALRDPVPIDDVEQEPLFVDRLAIVARAGHPLAGMQRPSLEKMTNYGWVVPRPGAPTREHFEELMTDVKRTPPLVETSSLILARGLLLESDRLAIISAHQVRHEIDQGLLVQIPVDLSASDRPIGLTLRRDWVPTNSQQGFLDALHDASHMMARPS